jgi:transcriptional regulator with XRE-family HTH domain
LKSNLPKIMESKGVTIRALESLSGVSNVTILRARKGDEGDTKDKKNISNCTLGTLAVLARTLGVSVHDLFDDDPGQQEPGDK